ncbi:MAG: CapA family protein [Promethearchaeota archaeon]
MGSLYINDFLVKFKGEKTKDFLLMLFIRKNKNKGGESKRKSFGFPYSLRELINWLKRYTFGPKKRNEGNIKYIPKNHLLNEITPKYTISFIGDIMDLSYRDLIIDENVKNFVRGSDFLIGNFEAIITSEKKINIMTKRHKPQIMDALASLFLPKKTYLSIANNHTGDYDLKSLSNSINQLKERGFNIFGTTTNPFVDLNEEIRVITGTQWSNQPCNYSSKLRESEHYLKQDSFNILFPHWGYELELYPRIGIINQGRDLLSKFDALIGHHTHCPQPISFFNIKNLNKLIAFSLGDFCFGWDLRKKKNEMLSYGIALKVEIGVNPQGQLIVGNIDWTFLKSRPFSEKEFIVEIVNDISQIYRLCYELKSYSLFVFFIIFCLLV